MERHKKHLSKKLYPAIGAIAVLIVLGIIYFAGATYYEHHFFPHTTVNDVNVSGMTATEADDTLNATAKDYLLTIFDKDGNKTHLTGTDFDYTYTLSASSASVLNQQNGLTWPTQLTGEHTKSLDVTSSYDEAKLQKSILALDLFDSEKTVAPVNAYLSETKDGYEIIPEETGNTLNQDTAISTIATAVKDGQTELTLGSEDYETPTILADDEKLVKALDTINGYLSTSITYDLGDSTEVLDAATIKDWFSISADNDVTFDDSKVTDYVQSLASKYNTYGDKRQFKTSAGDTVTIGGGDYGWVIDKEKEAAQLQEDLKSDTPIEREPIYNQTGFLDKYSTTDDIGNTYIEIDYTNQHLWYYVDGALVSETDIVSGNISTHNGSPDGIYKIVYKKSPAVLVGENYASDVTFFMPFAYNVGIHDASWRKPAEFGGQTYKTKGSHGCINVSYDFISAIYNQVETGTPVIAYYREPVTLTAENARISNAYSYVADTTAQ